MAVKLTWRQWWTPDAAQNIYRDTQEFSRSTLPAVFDTVASEVTTYEDTSAAEGDVYWYAVGASLNGVEVISRAVRVTSGDGSEAGGGGVDPAVLEVISAAATTTSMSYRYSSTKAVFAEPADWQDGDIVVVLFVSDYANGTTGESLSRDTTLAWTSIYQGHVDGHSVVWSTVAYAVLNGEKTWASQTTFKGEAWGWAAGLVVLRDAAYENHAAVKGFSGMPDPPELTGFDDGDLVLAVGHLDDDRLLATAPAGYTLAAADHGTYGIARASLMAAYKVSEGGAEDPDVFGGDESDDWAAGTIRFVPQAATPSVEGDIKFDAGMVYYRYTISNSDLTLINDTAYTDVREWTPTTRKLPGAATAPFYWEFECNSAGPTAFNGYHGVAADAIYYDWNVGTSNPIYDGSLGYRGNGDVWGNSSSRLIAGATTSYGAGDILMMAFDPSTGELWIGKNGVWRDDPDTDAATVTSTAAGNDFWVFVQGRGPAEGGTLRYKASQFSYTMPSSCVALGDVAD